MSKRTEAQKRADEKYRKNKLDYITFVAKKTDRLRDLIKLAADGNKISSNAYMICAIKNQLALDGINTSMLQSTPTMADEEPKIKEAKQRMCYMVTSFYAEPEEFKKAKNRFYFDEEYRTVVGTVSAAKDYIKTRFSKKAYPENYHYVIYGRSIESYSKLEAINKYKEIARKAVEDSNREIDRVLEAEEDDTIRIKTFIGFVNDFKKPDYVEVVNYEDL